MMNRSIYIHIPFCDSKCAYCDFVSGKYNEETISEYIEELKTEIQLRQDKTCTISTIFIGGGTPSSIDVRYIAEIIEKVRHCFNVTKDAEITIEANPCSVSDTKLKIYKQIGINRISFGVQSLNNKILKIIGRRHNKKQALDAICIAKQNGFYNINADILLGLPKQKYKDIKYAIKTLIKQDITHISCYMLINEEGTPLTKQIQSGKIKVLTDDKCVDFYDRVYKLLSKYNFKRYEVSNFSKVGYECKHNIAYWDTDEYYGFGLSAHSYIDNVRSENTSNIKKYLNKEHQESFYKLTITDKIEERLMLGLRQTKGVCISNLKNLGYDILKEKENEIKTLIGGEYIIVENDFIKISPKHFGVGDAITLKLLP